jgi:hypothetical protein
MSTATIGDVVVARKSAKKSFGVRQSSRWKIIGTTEDKIDIQNGRRVISLSYVEISTHFDLLAQINRIQIIK